MHCIRARLRSLHRALPCVCAFASLLRDKPIGSARSRPRSWMTNTMKSKPGFHDSLSFHSIYRGLSLPHSARDERLFARSPHRLATDRRSCGRSGRAPFRTLSRVLVVRKRPDGALTVCGRCEFEVWCSAENEWHLGGGYDLIAA